MFIKAGGAKTVGVVALANCAGIYGWIRSQKPKA